jgi:hypothetical protein
MSDQNKNLYYLNELSDYKVASNYLDVRNWKVMDSQGRIIGIVDGLLVSIKAERVVYLDIVVDETVINEGREVHAVPASEGAHQFLNSDGNTHLIIPIGLVSLNEENKTVCAEQLDYSIFTRARRFRKGAEIPLEYELFMYRYYTGDDSLNNTSNLDDSFYKRPEFSRKWVRH